MKDTIKALWVNAEKPYKDYGDILQIGRAEAKRITRSDSITILNILSCSSPMGFVVVFRNGGSNANGGFSEKNRT